MNTTSDETAHMHKVFEAMAETEKLQVEVQAAPEGEPAEIPVDFFTGLLNSRTI